MQKRLPDIQKRLADAGYDTGEAYMLARLALEHAAEQNNPAEALEAVIEGLLRQEPIQYLTGKGHFYGRDFIVSPDVLIPRQETEELAVWIRDEVLKSGQKTPHVLDIGTGSGCIPITLDLEWKERGLQAIVVGVDVSEKALKIASENGLLLGSDVTWRQMDILQAADTAFTHLDLIVSNPPYIPAEEFDALPDNVRLHEPATALIPPGEQLLFYRKIAGLALHWLKAGGSLYFEIHEDFGPQMVALLQEKGFENIRLRRDLRGRDRMVGGRKAAF